MLLFHGTDAANIDSIFREGFKVNFEPKHKTKMNLYGRGIYVAEHPELAFAYSKHENNQGNTLLLCKVAFCTLNLLNISFPGGAWQSANVRSHTSTFPGWRGGRHTWRVWLQRSGDGWRQYKYFFCHQRRGPGSSLLCHHLDKEPTNLNGNTFMKSAKLWTGLSSPITVQKSITNTTCNLKTEINTRVWSIVKAFSIKTGSQCNY